MYPEYLFEYPNIDSQFPFYMKKKSYTSVPAHRHDFIEFSLVLEGTGTERINDTRHEMRRGTICLLLPYQIHEYRADPNENLLMYICNFDMKLLTAGPESAWGLQALFAGRENGLPPYVQVEGQAYEECLRLWDKLYQEYESALAWKPIMLRALLLEALSLYVRSSGLQDTPAAVQPEPPPAPGRSFWAIVQYVYDHYLEPLSLTLLAERFHIHPTQLSTDFGACMGIHFVDFLHELRIRHACSLLLSSELPIAQVGYESGFSSYPTFARTFQHIKGMTPRQYRQQRERSN